MKKMQRKFRYKLMPDGRVQVYIVHSDFLVNVNEPSDSVEAHFNFMNLHHTCMSNKYCWGMFVSNAFWEIQTL